jgi:hypothetical protein
MPKYGGVRLYYYVAIGVFGQAVKRGNARTISQRAQYRLPAATPLIPRYGRTLLRLR